MKKKGEEWGGGGGGCVWVEVQGLIPRSHTLQYKKEKGNKGLGSYA